MLTRLLLDFFFGRDNLIFDIKGQAIHHLPKERWDAWQQRYSSNPEYNWKNHSGMKAKERNSSR